MFGAVLLNRESVVIARLAVEGVDGHFAGTIDLALMPAELRGLFEEWETLVREQGFSLLDEIDDRISQHGLRVRFEEGPTLPLDDLQICPSTRSVFFRTPVAAPLGAPAAEQTHGS